MNLPENVCAFGAMWAYRAVNGTWTAGLFIRHVYIAGMVAAAEFKNSVSNQVESVNMARLSDACMLKRVRV